MNMSFYTQMMRINLKMFLGFGLGSAIYVTLMTSVFPMLNDNMEEFDKMLELVPEALLRALGLESLSSYAQFISAEYYGLFYLLILGVFSVMNAIQLIARLVDRGSMAYLLSTRVSRTQIITTQRLVFVSGLVLIHLMTFAGGYIAAEFLFDIESNIAFDQFFFINFVGFLLFFAVGGYSLLISALFNDERNAFALAGGITFLFYGMDMIGKIVTDIDWIRNFTPFSLYEPGRIANGEADILMSSIILGSIGIIACVLTLLIFKKRNLPL